MPWSYRVVSVRQKALSKVTKVMIMCESGICAAAARRAGGKGGSNVKGAYRLGAMAISTRLAV